MSTMLLILSAVLTFLDINHMCSNLPISFHVLNDHTKIIKIVVQEDFAFSFTHNTIKYHKNSTYFPHAITTRQHIIRQKFLRQTRLNSIVCVIIPRSWPGIIKLGFKQAKRKVIFWNKSESSLIVRGAFRVRNKKWYTIWETSFLTYQFCRVLLYEVFTESDELCSHLLWRAFSMAERKRATLVLEYQWINHDLCRHMNESKSNLTLCTDASYILCLLFQCHCGHKSEKCLSNPQANPFLPKDRAGHGKKMFRVVSCFSEVTVVTELLTFRLFKKLDSMLGWNLFSSATWPSYLGPNIVFIGRNFP